MTAGAPARVRPRQSVRNTLFRALAVLRALMLVNSIVLYAIQMDSYPHPLLGWVVLAVLALWSAFTAIRFPRARDELGLLLVIDLALAVVAIALTTYVKGPDATATLPVFWVATVVLAWAVAWRQAGGLAAGLVVAAVDLIRREEITQFTLGNVFLLVVGGLIVGFLSGLLQRLAVELDQANQRAAVAAERQRLARVVHDGVLQVLALVQRSGHDLGPRGQQLAGLAAEQETRLRNLVQLENEDREGLGKLDLAAALLELGNARVTVSVPGGAVPVEQEVGSEVVAAVRECLVNVTRHVGDDAPAWVLLEDLGAAWEISVRDDGPGIGPGVLEAASAAGRLGVRESVVGRMRDLGGRATLVSPPHGGTEWQLTLPKAAGRSVAVGR